MLTSQAPAGQARRELFHERNYRLLWAGQAMALLGEQINLIALPWLALQLTGDAFALGSILAVGGIPPAILTLLGGMTTDRLSQRTIMLLADAMRFVLAAILILTIVTGSIALWVLYAVSLGFGLLSAFYLPAAGSIVPVLVGGRNLQTANSLFQSLSQLAALVGPAAAGILIQAGTSPATGATSTRASASGPGLAWAFGIYAFGLLLSVITLSLLRPSSRPSVYTGRRPENVIQELGSGLSYAWRDPLLRILVGVLLVLNLLLIGPLTVGIPVLARARLPEGAAAYGLLAAGFGGGNLFGALLASVIRRTKGVGALLTELILGFGATLFVIGSTSSTALSILVVFLVGAGNGYLGIIIRTLLHRRTPRELLGRVMGVYFFARAALVPISQAVSGAVIDVNLEVVFWGAGALLILVAAWLALSPAPRLFELQVEQAQPGTQ